MKANTLPWVAFFILAYCLWNSIDLFAFWKETAWNDASLLCFLLWCSPLLLKHIYPHPALLFIALGLSFLGSVGETHILENLGFSFAIGSFYPFSWLSLIWILSSIAWAPAFMWIASQVTWHIQVLRIVIIVLPVLGLFVQTLYQRKTS